MSRSVRPTSACSLPPDTVRSSRRRSRSRPASACRSTSRSVTRPDVLAPRIVVAPDKFKGSCTAAQAATAIVAGLRDVWGDEYTYQQVPMADGGEGTVQAFLDDGAAVHEVAVRGPLGDTVTAR